jgi:hypothetical protein
MIWPRRPFTRRSFVLPLLIAPMTCLGCGEDRVTVNTKAGAKRRQRLEDLRKKAGLKRKSEEKKAPSR